MWKWNRFAPMAIICTVIFVSPLAPAIALEPQEIALQAEKFVVRIDGGGGGSGFIVSKSGNRYTVLTNEHVINSRIGYTIVTADNRRHTINSSRIRKFPGIDLAEVEFISPNSYTIAELSNNLNTLSSGRKVYTYGFNAISEGLPERTSQFLAGTIAGTLQRGRNGYSLTFNLTAIPGLSGSPLIDEDGKIIGIYGLADRQSGGFTVTLGIPVTTYFKYFNPKLATASVPFKSNPVTRQTSKRRQTQQASNETTLTELDDPTIPTEPIPKRRVALTIIAEKQVIIGEEVTFQQVTNGKSVKPGDVLRYTVIAKNSDKAVRNLILTQPIPRGTAYLKNSSSILNGSAEVLFSIDGGKSYSDDPKIEDRSAPTPTYTNVRWKFTGVLPSQSQVEASYSVVVK
jgi:uncharacterized repeat protein (TIGR01451 family)